MFEERSWLSISLWDFSWVTQAGPGQPFADLDLALREAVARGYNTVRIDAMPLLFFDDRGNPRSRLTMLPLPGSVGRGTRWYNQRQAVTVEPLPWLLGLFRAARHYGCQVIVSSWEYQQTLSFAADREIVEEILAISPPERFDRLARGMDHLLRFLSNQGLDDTVAYVELHNEVNASRLTEVGAVDPLQGMRPHLERALSTLEKAHPRIRVTAGYTNLPVYRLDALPANLQVMHQHIYEYGPLKALNAAAGFQRRHPSTYPTDFARSLWQADVPALDAYVFPEDQSWREQAIGWAQSRHARDLFHFFDATDPERYDAWLYAHWQDYRQAVLDGIRLRLEAYAYEAKRRGIPAIIGEGWIGWTPLTSRFECEAAGKEVIRQALSWAKELGYQGAVVCSNYAPHHPEWADVVFQHLMNAAAQGKSANLSGGW